MEDCVLSSNTCIFRPVVYRCAPEMLHKRTGEVWSISSWCLGYSQRREQNSSALRHEAVHRIVQVSTGVILDQTKEEDPITQLKKGWMRVLARVEKSRLTWKFHLGIVVMLQSALQDPLGNVLILGTAGESRAGAYAASFPGGISWVPSGVRGWNPTPLPPWHWRYPRDPRRPNAYGRHPFEFTQAPKNPYRNRICVSWEQTNLTGSTELISSSLSCHDLAGSLAFSSYMLNLHSPSRSLRSVLTLQRRPHSLVTWLDISTLLPFDTTI